VLLAVDGSDEAGAAQRLLASLPLPPGSAVHLVTVLDAHAWQVPVSLRGAEQEWAQKVVERAQVSLPGTGIEFSHATPRGAPAHEILAAAEQFGAELIVVGSRKQGGLESFLLGSVARNVAQHARVPVLLAREPVSGLSRLLLAVDDSPFADHAVRLAARLPLPTGIRITVAHVIRPYEPYAATGPEILAGIGTVIEDVRREQREEAARLVEGAQRQLARCGKSADFLVREGDPAHELIEAAQEVQADLLISGARGSSVIKELIVGSVADRLMKSAPCSVLLTH
jgi:nucleotide-binding universal stress UspA family protein